MRRRYYTAGTGKAPQTNPGIPGANWVETPEGVKYRYFGTFSEAEVGKPNFVKSKAVCDLGIELLVGFNRLLDSL